MTDFFAHLAARYRGETDVLQPRVPFRFEPVSTSQAATDPIETGAWEPAPHPQREQAQRQRPGPAAGQEAGWAAVRPRPPAAPARPEAPRGQAASTPPARVASAMAVPARAVPARAVPARAVPARAVQARAVPAARPQAAGEEAAGTAGLTGAARVIRPVPVAGTAPERGTPSRWPRFAAGLDEQAPGTALGPARRHPAAAPAPAAAPGGMDRQPAPGGRRASGQHHAAVPAPGGPENITVQVTIGRVEVRAAPPAAAERPASAPAAGPSLADYLQRKARARP